MYSLEAATSRLEDLTVFQEETLRKSSNKSVTIDPNSKDDEPAIEDKRSSGVSDSGGAAKAINANEAKPEAPAVKPAALQEFDSFLSEFVDPFVSMSKTIDPVVEEQVMHLAKAFASERKFLDVALQSQKPVGADSGPTPAYVELFQPIAKQGEAISNVRENNRASKYINHLATIAEGVPALGWVNSDLPVPYITDFKDSAQFYANKVLKEYKESDKKQIEWVQHFLKLLNALQAYVKKFHTTGVSWNSSGKPLDVVLKEQGGSEEDNVSEKKAAPSPPPPSASGGAPPPPPPPMPPASVFKVDEGSQQKSSGGGMNAVFAELNKGEAVTSGLKKVDKSEMTHKNPELRRAGSAENKKPSPPPPKKPASLSKKPTKKPARKELEDTKWYVENYENEHELVINGEMNQGVFIEKCNNCTVQIKGKVSAVSLNECSKVGILVENLVSGFDVIKCSSFGIQVTGALPTLSIDQSHEGQVYLSKQSLDVEIYTAQTSGLNINLPKNEEQGDYSEVPLPEQIVHKITNGKITSEIVEHEG
ncbi:hypothetical protein TRICI_003312 [Trichomonascus ciferrii]|uniref:Adenylyl cyclase-associated protein n=1 Tax=Trichomonascus ciferrii TaxID=44093 RepID=A0A642V980_9ASCO|nr:hypothetical protein TRICI_003312 [Trichomonascus ciferrii]